MMGGTNYDEERRRVREMVEPSDTVFWLFVGSLLLLMVFAVGSLWCVR